MQLLLNTIIDFLIGIVDWLISLMPAIDINVGDFVGAVAHFFGYIDTLISLDVVVACIAVVIVVDNFAFFTRILKFILNKFLIG